MTSIDALLMTNDPELANRLAPDSPGLRIAETLRPTKRGLAAVRKLEASGSARLDVILFDFRRPTGRGLDLAIQLVCAPRAARIPVIWLITPESEQLLDSRELECCDTTSFAPIALDHFMLKLAQHREQRFLRALALLYELGPILVRVPAELCGEHAGYALTG